MYNPVKRQHRGPDSPVNKSNYHDAISRDGKCRAAVLEDEEPKEFVNLTNSVSWQVSDIRSLKLT